MLAHREKKTYLASHISSKVRVWTWFGLEAGAGLLQNSSVLCIAMRIAAL